MLPDPEFSWLLEKGDRAQPLYVAVVGELLDWTADRDLALRFAREVDAEAMALVIYDADRVCLHAWNTAG